MILYIHIGISILTLTEFHVVLALARKEARKRGITVRRQKDITKRLQALIYTTVVSFMPIFNIFLLYVMLFGYEEAIERLVKKLEISDEIVKRRTTNEPNRTN